MRKSFLLALITVTVISLAISAFSFFIQPILPANTSKFLGIFSAAFLSILGVLTRFKEITEFFQSLFHNTTHHKENSLNSKISQSVRVRAIFLDNITPQSNVDELQEDFKDLVEFIKNIPQGKYYAEQIEKLTEFTGGGFSLGSKEDLIKFREQLKISNKEYRQQLLGARSKIYALLDEFLKTQ